MEEFDAPQEHGVKQMRETIGRKDDTIKKLEAELESYNCLLYTSPSPRDRG